MQIVHGSVNTTGKNHTRTGKHFSVQRKFIPISIQIWSISFILITIYYKKSCHDHTCLISLFQTVQGSYSNVNNYNYHSHLLLNLQITEMSLYIICSVLQEIFVARVVTCKCSRNEGGRRYVRSLKLIWKKLESMLSLHTQIEPPLF